LRKYIRFLHHILVLFVYILILSACSAIPRMDWTVRVDAVSQTLELSYADLAELPQTELKDVLMQKTTSEDTNDSWSGPALTEIMNTAGADPNFSSILVTGIDGYQAMLSPGELEGAIIALKKDGEWIAETDMGHGPIRLVCPKTPANKWVYSIVEIQFMP